MSSAAAANDDEPAPGSRPVQRFQLNGDARLQFWREVYRDAMGGLIQAFAPYGVSPDTTRQIATMAAELADMACAQHLLRNDAEWPDVNVDYWVKLKSIAATPAP